MGSCCTCGDFNFTSHSGGTIFSFTSLVGDTWWQLFSSAWLEEFTKVLNTSKVLPKPTHRVQHFHMVKKADGTWRPCGHYRLLNLQMQPDLYMCPNIADLTARLEGCTIFSKLDLRKGFH